MKLSKYIPTRAGGDHALAGSGWKPHGRGRDSLPGPVVGTFDLVGGFPIPTVTAILAGYH
jgi:hypothetical protein